MPGRGRMAAGAPVAGPHTPFAALVRQPLARSGRANLVRAADLEPKLGKVVRGSYVKVLGSGVMPAARNSWDRGGGLASQAIKDTR